MDETHKHTGQRHADAKAMANASTDTNASYFPQPAQRYHLPFTLTPVASSVDRYCAAQHGANRVREINFPRELVVLIRRATNARVLVAIYAKTMQTVPLGYNALSSGTDRFRFSCGVWGSACAAYRNLTATDLCGCCCHISSPP